MNLQDAVRRQFAPATGPARRIGAEIELIAVTEEPHPRPADPAVLVAGFDARFRAAARPSFEPGGQLELSLPPQTSVAALIGDAHRQLHRAMRVAADCGVRLESTGVNPYHSCDDVPLRSVQPRYLEMQRLFDEVGPNGRRMMRLTASLQVAVDLATGEAGREQWLVANLAGPVLAAAFANSPYVDGRPAGIDGARTRIWQGVDLRRTGYDGRHLDTADPVGAYAAFAAKAERFAIPEAAAPEYHLSTLFPPVRPRGGYLELRYLDAQPVERIPEVLAVIDVLLNDARTRREVLDLLLPRLGQMDEVWGAAAVGFSPDSADLLAIADAGASRRRVLVPAEGRS
jgi:glutamate--cysteine ligase